MSRKLFRGRIDFISNDRLAALLAKTNLHGDFETLLDKFRGKVWSYLLQKVPFVEVEDIFQIVCMQVFTGMNRLQDPEKLIPWVMTLTRRRVQDYYAERKKKEPIDNTPVYSLDPSDDLDLDRRLHLLALRRCIQELGDPYREVAILHFVVGLTSKEIHQVLDLKESTVKSHIHRAKPKILDCLLGCRKGAP